MKLKYLSYSVVLGAGTGLAFAVFLWGYEMLLLIKTHVAYAWLPGVIGMVSCTVICTTAAILTRVSNNALLGVVFWVLAAVGIAQLLIAIPIRIAPALMAFFEPGIGAYLSSLPANDSFVFWVGTATIWLAIFFGILGVLQNTLVEGAVPAIRPVGRWAPYLLMIPVMLIASSMSGNVINEQLREPLITTSNLIQFAVDHQNEPVSFEAARAVRLNALDLVVDLINEPYRLFLGSYDKNFGQVDVYVDFDGQWVDCLLIYAQPISCELTGQ